jgi:hypothetical protein
MVSVGDLMETCRAQDELRIAVNRCDHEARGNNRPQRQRQRCQHAQQPEGPVHAPERHG